MKIEWLGHAAFKITSEEGVRILTDPYESGGYSGAIGYSPIEESFDIVTISHAHSDHSYTKNLPGEPTILKGASQKKLRDVTISSLESYHDPVEGRARGGNSIFILEVSGVKIVHLGDLGHSLDINTASKLSPVDILLLPVGGTFTIDAKTAASIIDRLKPGVTIPMHYKTPKLKFNIDGIEPFLREAKGAKLAHSSGLEFRKGQKTNEGIVVLEPSH